MKRTKTYPRTIQRFSLPDSSYIDVEAAPMAMKVLNQVFDERIKTAMNRYGISDPETMRVFSTCVPQVRGAIVVDMKISDTESLS